MTAALGGLVGLLLALGVAVIVVGLQSAPVLVQPKRAFSTNDARSAGAIVAGVLVGWVVTGWPAVGILSGCAAAVTPRLLAARREKQRLLDQTAALATWTEMLHDTVASHAGIQQALATSCDVAPEVIRDDLQRLMYRAGRGSLADALRRFGDDMADPVSDMVVAALVIAIEGRARDLPQLLAEIAASARRQASTQLRIETGRSRTYAQARSLVGITMVGAVGLILFSPQFMAPYDSFAGQLVLGLVASLFALALWMMIALSQPVQSPRLFGTDGTRYEAEVAEAVA